MDEADTRKLQRNAKHWPPRVSDDDDILLKHV